MRRIARFWKIVVFDTIGVALMVAAILTGWLPGPGGIPLFIIGLSILAIHHEWANKYIELLKKNAHKLGEFIFVSKPQIQLAYDLLSPIVLVIGVVLLLKHSAVWMVSIGIFCVFTAVTFMLGNRRRWHRLQKAWRKKS